MALCSASTVCWLSCPGFRLRILGRSGEESTEKKCWGLNSRVFSGIWREPTCLEENPRAQVPVAAAATNSSVRARPRAPGESHVTFCSLGLAGASWSMLVLSMITLDLFFYLVLGEGSSGGFPSIWRLRRQGEELTAVRTRAGKLLPKGKPC